MFEHMSNNCHRMYNEVVHYPCPCFLVSPYSSIVFNNVCSTLQETKLSVVCERVLDRCLAPSTAGGEGCDNMTMILVQFKKPIQPNVPASTNQEPSPSEPAAEVTDSKQEPEQT